MIGFRISKTDSERPTWIETGPSFTPSKPLRMGTSPLTPASDHLCFTGPALDPES
jgi:hypothetical protein